MRIGKSVDQLEKKGLENGALINSFQKLLVNSETFAVQRQ
jgi:hypothetical protein